MKHIISTAVLIAYFTINMTASVFSIISIIKLIIGTIDIEFGTMCIFTWYITITFWYKILVYKHVTLPKWIVRNLP